MDRVCNGNAGIFISAVRKNTLETLLGRVYEKTPVLCSSTTCFPKSKKEVKSLFRFLKLVVLTSSWTKFHCVSREAKSPDCCFDRYKLRTRSFRSSCMIQCGSLPLVHEYVDSISFKDIDSAESSLEGISSSDEERRSLFTGGVGTERSSERGRVP